MPPISFIKRWIALCSLFFYVTASFAQTVTYIHNDPFGNPVAATNASGALVWKETYYPYGERIAKAPASSNNSLWFSGKPQDPKTNLSYFGARYYHPQLGRFMALDPEDFSPDNLHSFNRYAYGNNSPYKYGDPDGQLPFLLLLIPVAQAAGWGAVTGAALGAGTSVAVQYATTGQVDAGQVGKDALISGGIGLVTGGIGGYVNAARGAGQVGASNVAAYQAYKDGLRAAMSKPTVSDSSLARLIDPLYRSNAAVGSGSTAAAVRQELATGQPVSGAFHSQKAGDSIKALERWLANNPSARPGDKAAAENVIRDMNNALRGR